MKKITFFRQVDLVFFNTKILSVDVILFPVTNLYTISGFMKVEGCMIRIVVFVAP